MKNVRIEEKSETLPFEMSIFETGLFPTRTRNALAMKGRLTVQSILDIPTYKELCNIRDLGSKSCADIIAKMRQMGHNDWADKMISDMKAIGIAK